MLADYKFADSNAEENQRQIGKLRNTCGNAGKSLYRSHASYPDTRHAAHQRQSPALSESTTAVERGHARRRSSALPRTRSALQQARSGTAVGQKLCPVSVRIRLESL